MSKKPANSDTPEIGDTVVFAGEVVHVDADGWPRVKVSGMEYPVLVSPVAIIEVIKGQKGPKWDKPD